jgi:hypothetical protein
VIRGKNRLEQEGQVPQQWFIGANLPIVGDVHELGILFERPGANAVEVAPRFE